MKINSTISNFSQELYANYSFPTNITYPKYTLNYLESSEMKNNPDECNYYFGIYVIDILCGMAIIIAIIKQLEKIFLKYE